jgi:hypothetical protein
MLSGAMDSLAPGFGRLGLAAPALAGPAAAGPHHLESFLDCLAAFGGPDTTRDQDVGCCDAPLRPPPPAGAPVREPVHASAPAPPQRWQPRQPVRLHLYHDPASGACQVWIGLDASTGGVLAVQVAAVLQEAIPNDWPQLARLVCNGREIELAHPAAPRRRNAPERRT